MLSFAHFGLLMAFVFIGALGMAAMQDAMGPLWRHMRLSRRIRTYRPQAGQRTSVRPLPERMPWAKATLR